MIKYSRCINNLPSQILVIQMPHKQRLCGERVGLDIDICASDFVDEGGFSDVGIAANEESAGIGVYGWETGYMLADLFEVC